MAKANGIIKIEGTVEELTFYRREGKDLVRKKGGVSKERIETDPNYVRTRENNAEFGHSGICGKQLRLALGSLVFKAKDSKLTSRLLRIMSRIKNLDGSSARGERKVWIGLDTPEGKAELSGFDFNSNAPLQSVLFAPFSLNTTTGVFSFTDFIPAEELMIPQGATHVSLQSAVLTINLEKDTSVLALSPVVNLPIDLTVSSPTLTPSSVPATDTVLLFLLTVAFYQEVNGTQYSLKNNEFNVLQVVEVV